MSKKMMKASNCKPPLCRSPIRLRSRRVLQPNSNNNMQTPPGSVREPQKPKCFMDIEGSDLRPEYRAISCELRDLAKRVKQEFGKENAENVGFAGSFDANRSPLFERGRYYEEYTAKRNERLKRKKGEMEEEKNRVRNQVESVKRRGEVKKLESVKKVVPSTPMAERREAPRYLLRSITSKQNKKPPPATPSAGTEQRKTATKRTRNI